MLQIVGSTSKGAEISTARDEFIKAFRWMLLARVLDEKFATLYRAGKIHGGVFLGKGQEALSVAVGQLLRKGDVFAPLIRDTAGRLAFGGNILDPVRTYLGSAAGPMRGRDGNVHWGRPKEGLLPMISHLGAMISVVNGMLLARRLKGVHGTVGATCIGDGGTSTGSFHEALNQAAVEKLPLVLVVANNQYAYSTSTARQFACADLVDKAPGYGVAGHEVDGTDLAECLEVIGAAIANAREGKGPQLVVADLLRLCGHAVHDDAHYMDPKLKQTAVGRDCIEVARQYVIRKNWAELALIESWRQEAVDKVEQTVAAVQRESGPDPFKESWSAMASKHFGETHPEP
jgi:pyruvate dehydrogenase E1 component alpha subunit/2-oxoisovalerate dehydrogenase E1 component alpha subunit